MASGESPEKTVFEPSLKRAEQKIDPRSARDEKEQLGERHGVRPVYP
jgi:hypothetical protein